MRSARSRSVQGRRLPRTNRPSVLALEGRTLLSGAPRVDTFAVPTLGSSPSLIVPGASGDLWFAETTGAVGRITTAGQVAEFSLPIPSGGVTPVLGGLTAGPDGALWAVDVANNQVDRITADGQSKAFPLPAGQVETASSIDELKSRGLIVAGPDGNLWFGASSDRPNTPGVIDRMTPDGGVTAFPLPQGGGDVMDLAAGPGGVWFTDPSANRVGRVDSAGQISEYGVPTPANPVEVNDRGLAVGPDGNAYYITQSLNAIIQVAPGGTTKPVAVSSTGTAADLMGTPGGIVFEYKDNTSLAVTLSQLAPDGTLTALATDVPATSDVALGPDGNLWGTQLFPAEITRIVLADTPVPGPSLVVGTNPLNGFGPGGGPNLGLVAPVSEASTIGLAAFRHSADVTVDSSTIDWGDGSAPTAGTVAPNFDFNAIFPGPTPDPIANGVVSGTHTYAQAGSYTATVTVRGTGPDGAPLTVEYVAAIAAVDPTLTPRPALNVQAGQGQAFQGPVLEFAAPTPHDSSGADFTATIDWGDGSAPTAGTVIGGEDQSQLDKTTFVSYGPGVSVGRFEVMGGHTYAAAGSYTAKVTLTDSFGHASTASTPIQVVAGALAINPPPQVAATADPTNGASGSGPNWVDLGTLVDFQGNAAARSDSVQVDWGDGSAPIAATLLPSTNDPSVPLSTASFDVSGTHFYAKAGTYTVKLTAVNLQGATAEATATAQIAPRTLTVVPANPAFPGWGNPFDIQAAAGRPTTPGPLFAITTPSGSDPASAYTAMVDWGDGSAPTSELVEPAAAASGVVPVPASVGDLLVAGGHTYAKPGLYAVQVTVVGPDGSTAQAMATASIALAGVQSLFPSLPAAFAPGVVTPPAALANLYLTSNASADDFRATVNWGDGSATEPAQIQPSTLPAGSGSWDVVAGHTYAAAGTYAMTITVIGPDGIPAVATNQATVFSTPVLVTDPGTPPPPSTLPATPIPPTTGTEPAPVPTLTTAPPIPPAAPPAQPTPTPVPTSTAPNPPAALLAPRSNLLPGVNPRASGPIRLLILPSPFPRFAPVITHRALHPRARGHHHPARPVAHHPTTATGHAAHPARGTKSHPPR